MKNFEMAITQTSPLSERNYQVIQRGDTFEIYKLTDALKRTGKPTVVEGNIENVIDLIVASHKDRNTGQQLATVHILDENLNELSSFNYLNVKYPNS